MTQRERQLLEWIRENPMISQQELADKAGITRSSVAVHISNLMKKGCITGKGYIVRTDPYVAVVGGVNMDIGAVSAGALVARDSNPGHVTTDVICGFPQETEEEFSATLAFLEECRFAAMHVFPYSIRPGTKAADMPQVPGPVKEERAARAGALAARLHRAYLEECVGRTYPVLFEQPAAGRYGGHAPNYMEVAVSGGEDLHNRVLPVRITGTDGEILWGELE